MVEASLVMYWSRALANKSHPSEDWSPKFVANQCCIQQQGHWCVCVCVCVCVYVCVVCVYVCVCARACTSLSILPLIKYLEKRTHGLMHASFERQTKTEMQAQTQKTHTSESDHP
jgi:hypothetical protein